MLRKSGIILASVALGWALATHSRPATAEASVTALPASAKPMARLIAGAGRVEPASEEIQVGADLYGRIRSVLVEEGQKIHQGQTLAVLMNDDYQARVDLAAATVQEREAALERLLNGSRVEQRSESKAALQEAEAVRDHTAAERERKTKLFQAELISRMEFEAAEREFLVARARVAAARERTAMVDDESRPEDIRRARAALLQARAQLEEARALLAKTLITSPIDGVVLRKKMKAGESITALSNQPVVTVGDCSRLRVRVDVDETDVARVHVGQRAWVRADAYGDRKIGGTVIRVGNILGRKNVRTDEPAEKVDQKVLETLVELDAGASLPAGLRVDAFIQPD